MGRTDDSRQLDLLPGTLYMLILKTLARLGSAHGYGIAQFIKQTTDEVLRVEEGSLYPALQRMLVKGWVTDDWQRSENNRQARYYRLTPAGRKQLTVEVSGYSAMIEAIQRVLAPAPE